MVVVVKTSIPGGDFMRLKKFREGGGILCLRKVMVQNGSFLLTLPIDFVRQHNIKAGDLLPVVGGQHLIIHPPQVQESVHGTEPETPV